MSPICYIGSRMSPTYSRGSRVCPIYSIGCTASLSAHWHPTQADSMPCAWLFVQFDQQGAQRTCVLRAQNGGLPVQRMCPTSMRKR